MSYLTAYRNWNQVHWLLSHQIRDSISVQVKNAASEIRILVEDIMDQIINETSKNKK